MRAVAALRLLAALLVLAAVAATWLAVPPPKPAVQDFFGYFTIQSNLIGAAVGIAAVIRGRRRATVAWTVVRWSAATYLVVVGIVYWAVLAPLGAAGGVAVPWANLVLHAVLPAAALVDWLLAPDRVPIPARLLAAVLVYPLLWTAVVLLRGATDGWVPYPFLSPTQGYAVVWSWVALVAGMFAGCAALLRVPSRRPATARA